MKTVPVSTGGDHILRTVNAFPCCRVEQSPAAADLQDCWWNSHCLANEFLRFFQSSALAVPLSLQWH